MLIVLGINKVTTSFLLVGWCAVMCGVRRLFLLGLSEDSIVRNK